MTINLPVPVPLPANKNIGIGCIGAGFIMADCQLVAYRNNGLQPLAIASRTLSRAQAVAERHQIPHAYDQFDQVLQNTDISILDIAVPPDQQIAIVRAAVRQPHIRGILVQKPMAVNYKEAKELVRLCRDAGKVLCVNQNMRYDQSIRACKHLLENKTFGDPVLATIDMRAIPHWMPWQKDLGWCTLRTMSIHHLDCFRYLFGDPVRVYASVRSDPRTTFPHSDGVCLYILEYENGLRAMACDDVWAGPAREGAADDIYINWRVEGTVGMARGTIGWPKYPTRTPSTLDYTTTTQKTWLSPRWDSVWFPDAFIGPMAELLCALEEQRTPVISGEDNLTTMALVDACYQSAREHRAIALQEIINHP